MVVLRKVLDVKPNHHQHEDDDHNCAKCGAWMSLNDGAEWGEDGDDICNTCAQEMITAARAAIRDAP